MTIRSKQPVTGFMSNKRSTTTICLAVEVQTVKSFPYLMWSDSMVREHVCPFVNRIYLYMSSHQPSCHVPFLHLPHRLFASYFRARSSLVNLFKPSARRPLLVPQSHCQPNNKSTQQERSHASASEFHNESPGHGVVAICRRCIWEGFIGSGIHRQLKQVRSVGRAGGVHGTSSSKLESEATIDQSLVLSYPS